MRVLASAFRFLVFSNIYISFCVLTFTVKTSLLLYGNRGNVKVNILVFSATLFLYGFHRLYHRSKMLVEERGEERHHWADEHRIVFITITSLAFLMATVFMFYMPLKVWILLLPVGIMGLGYSLPFIPTSSGWKRLRDISWLKILWIALAYAWLTTFIPVAYQSTVNELFNRNVLFVFFRSFLFVFVLVIPFDIRDLEHDKKNGMKTIPVLLGLKKTIQIALLLIVVFAILVWVQYRYYQLSAGVALALCVSIAETAIVIPLSKPGRPDLFYPLAIETSMIFHCVVIFLAVNYF